MSTSVVIEKKKTVWVIRLNRPEIRNALDKDMRDGIKQALRNFERDPEVRVAVLTGSGPAFCAGGHLKELSAGMGTAECLAYVADANEITLALTEIGKPVIACINGAAIGAGLMLALACDLVFASTEAVFSLAFAKVGLVPDMGGLYFLPRVLGLHKAKELMYTAKTFSAGEALAFGLVNQVLPNDELESHCLVLAGQIAQGPAGAFAMAKKLLGRGLELGLPHMLDQEALAQSLCIQSEDGQEGMRAFFEKRKPVFNGKLNSK